MKRLVAVVVLLVVVVSTAVVVAGAKRHMGSGGISLCCTGPEDGDGPPVFTP